MNPKAPKCLAVVISLWFGIAAAAGAKDPGAAALEELDRYERLVGSARNLALGALVAERDGASDATVERLAAAFATRESAARSAEAPLDAALREAGSPPDLGARAGRARALLQKASSHMARFKRTIPVEPAAAPAGGVRIRGDLLSGLGSASYKHPDAASRSGDASGTLFEGKARAETRLATGTLLSARLGREKLVDRREASLSDLAAELDHRFTSGLRLRGVLSRTGYAEPENDDAGYGEVTLGVTGTYPAGPARIELALDRRARAHTNDARLDDDARRDYHVSRARLALAAPFGGANLEARLDRVSRVGEAPGSDFTILNPALLLRSARTGSEAGASIERFRAPEGAGLDNDRIKLHAYRGRGGLEGRSWFGPEVLLYRMPGKGGAEYGDYGIAGGSASRTRSSSRIRAYYRHFGESAAFDFAAFSWQRRSASKEFGLTGQLYVEGADYDSLGEVRSGASQTEIYSALGQVVQAFQSTRPPDFLDLYTRLVWSLRGVECGPSLGHRWFIDTERNTLQKKADDLAALLPDGSGNPHPLGEQNFLYANTINRAHGGVRLSFNLAPTRDATCRVTTSYDVDVLYLADPIERITTLDFSVEGGLPVRPDLRVELSGGHHRSRLGTQGTDSDFNRTELFVRLRWLFDAAVGAMTP